MLKVLIKRVFFGLLFIPTFFIFLIWMDLRYNSAKLLKNSAEYSLAGKDFSVKINLITPDYLRGRFVLQGVRINSYNKEIASIDQAICSISLGERFLMFDLRFEPFDVYSAVVPNAYLTNVRALYSLDLKQNRSCIFLTEENNKEVGKILIEPSKIEGRLNKSFSQADLNGEIDVSFLLDRYRGSYQVDSKGNFDYLNVPVSRVFNALNWPCHVEGDIASCSWDINYNSEEEGEGDFSKFKNLKLTAQLINCLGTQNFQPIKQLKASFNLLNNRLIGEFSSDETGKNKSHEICLDYKNRILSGFGTLNSSLAPLIKRALANFSDSIKCLDSFVLNKDIHWNCFLNCITGDFNLIIKTRLNKAKVSVWQNDMLFSDVDLEAMIDQENLNIKALGILQNFDTKIDYQGTFERSGAQVGQIRLELLKSANFSNFKFEPGYALVKFRSSKEQDFGHKFCANCDLTNLAFFCKKIAFGKDFGKSALLKLNGIILEDESLFKLNLTGEEDLGIRGSCKVGESGVSVAFEDVCYFGNSYSLKSDISLKNTKTEIQGEVLDLSCTDFLELNKHAFSDKKSEFSVQLNSLRMKNGKTLNNVTLNSTYDGACYTHSVFHGYLEGDSFVNLALRSKNNTEERWLLSSNNAGGVVCALGLYEGMSFGSLKVSFVVDRESVSVNNTYPFISGEVLVGKFHLKDSPHPLIALLCPSTLFRPFGEKKYFAFTSLVASFYLDQGILNVEKVFAKSFSNDLVIRNVQIDPGFTSVKLSGEIAPSWYGVGNVVRKIPIVGPLVDRMKLPGFWLPYRVIWNSSEYK